MDATIVRTAAVASSDDVGIVVTGLRLQVTEPTLAAGAIIAAPDSAVGSPP